MDGDLLNRVLLAAALAIAALVGCGDDSSPAPIVVTGLSSEQGQLIGDICGFPGDPADRVSAERSRRRLNVLLRELRERPDARVRTYYYADGGLFEKGGRKSEILSLRQLANVEIDTDRQLRMAIGDTRSKSARCARSITARLEAAIN
ncbi:MAG: hypothetical protein ACRDMZ_17790 [Solirubrobacteraceae bacterium]